MFLGGHTALHLSPISPDTALGKSHGRINLYPGRPANEAVTNDQTQSAPNDNQFSSIQKLPATRHLAYPRKRSII
jgi:hypothetical protein